MHSLGVFDRWYRCAPPTLRRPTRSRLHIHQRTITLPTYFGLLSGVIALWDYGMYMYLQCIVFCQNPLRLSTSLTITYISRCKQVWFFRYARSLSLARFWQRETVYGSNLDGTIACSRREAARERCWESEGQSQDVIDVELCHSEAGPGVAH